MKSKQDNLVFFSRISPGYFTTMGTPLLIGRGFANADKLQAPKVDASRLDNKKVIELMTKANLL